MQKPLFERLEEATGKVHSEQINYSINPNLSPSPLSWKQALRLLEEKGNQQNQGLAQLQKLEKERKNFYWEQLNPRLSAVANLGAAIDELASLGSDTINFRLLGNITIPKPFTLYAERYALELQYYQAQLDFERSQRRSIAELYRTFLAQDDINYDKRLQSTRPDSLLTPDNLLQRLSQTKAKQQLQTEIRQKQITRRLNALFSTPGQNWRPAPETLPNLEYPKRFKKLSFEHGFGRLGLKQAAAQIEANRANVSRTKYDRLPTVNFNASLPTLYSNNSDSEARFEDIQLFTGTSKTFSFKDSSSRGQETAKERAKDTRIRISLELEREAANLKNIKQRYQANLDTEAFLLQKLSYLKTNSPQSSSSLVLAHLAEIQTTEENLVKTRRARRNIDLEFLIWDEDAWRSGNSLTSKLRR